MVMKTKVPCQARRPVNDDHFQHDIDSPLSVAVGPVVAVDDVREKNRNVLSCCIVVLRSSRLST